jgi:DHA1 family tetracycline resistance protein-like MFS transporter
LRKHPLIDTLHNLRGNARGCVLTEPMWGIPFNLYAPFVSVYMLAFGLSDSQIGLITTISLALQVFTSLLSGAIADKFGRRRTTLIVDIVSWGVPCLVWAFARDFNWFLVAALLNSLWRIVHTSWQCLLVEDTDPDLLVDVWSWIYIAGLLAAFVSPLTGLIIDRFELVPTMRALYLFAAIMMTGKAFVTNALVTETRQGLVRMRETRGLPLWSVLRGTPQILRQILSTPITLVTGGLIMVMGVYRAVHGAFWSILATQKLQVSAEYLALYPFARSITTLAFFFLVMPRLRRLDTRTPLLLGLLGLIVAQAILVLIPARSYLLLLLATILEGCSLPMASTHIEKLAVITVDAQERARILAILYTVVLVFTSPFGWIAGRMSEIERSLPFVLLLAMLVVGVALAYLGGRVAAETARKKKMAEQTAQI